MRYDHLGKDIIWVHVWLVSELWLAHFHRSVSFPPAGASRMLSDIVIVINLKKVKI